MPLTLPKHLMKFHEALLEKNVTAKHPNIVVIAISNKSVAELLTC